jgi:hypothetical protein
VNLFRACGISAKCGNYGHCALGRQLLASAVGFQHPVLTSEPPKSLHGYINQNTKKPILCLRLLAMAGCHKTCPSESFEKGEKMALFFSMPYSGSSLPPSVTFVVRDISESA